jgi:RNA polymerase sigma factor (sigma-70 family)
MLMIVEFAQRRVRKDEPDRLHDVIVMTLASLWSNLAGHYARFGTPEACRRFWFIAIRNHVFRTYRDEGRYRSVHYFLNDSATLDTVVEPVPDPVDAALARITLEREQERLQLQNEAAELTKREREMYVLKKFEKMSYQEAADKLGISKTRAHTLYKNAKAKIDKIEIESNDLIES